MDGAKLLTLALAFGAMGCGLDETERWDDGILLRPHADLLAVGGETDLTESVPGDVMAAGRSVTFDGTVGGSYLGAAGDQEIGGRIDGSVRAAGGYVRLEASVGRNVTVAGGSVDLEPATVVEGNAYLGGGSVRMLGEVAGDVYAGAGTLEIDGRVGGDVRAEAEHLRVGPNARIDGELRYRVAEDAVAEISPRAAISGGVEVLEPRERDDGSLGFSVARFLAFLLAGAVLIALLPGPLTDVSDEVTDHVAAVLGLGLVVALLAPLAVLVVAVTVVGIPLALILAVLYGVALYLAPAVTGLWLGTEILGGRDPTRRWDAVLIFLTGGSIVALAMLLPWIGMLARVLAVCLGLGAIVLTIRERATTPAGG